MTNRISAKKKECQNSGEDNSLVGFGEEPTYYLKKQIKRGKKKGC